MPVPARLKFFQAGPAGVQAVHVVPVWPQHQEDMHLISSYLGPANPPEYGGGTVAMVVEAHVEITGNAAGWDFGFVQLIRYSVTDISYRGQTTTDGSMFSWYYSRTEQGIMRKDQAVADRTQPWYDNRCHVAGSAGMAPNFVVKMADNPIQSPGSFHTNSTTHRINIARHVWKRHQFTTIFAARAPTGQMFAMQSFDWMVDWNFDIEYHFVSGQALPTTATVTRRDVASPPVTYACNMPAPAGQKTVGPPRGADLTRFPAIAVLFGSSAGSLPSYEEPPLRPHFAPYAGWV